MKVYRIKGTTDEVTTCDLCGRQELKGTVVLIALDADGNPDGDPSYFGTSCAAKAAGWTQRETLAKVKKVKAEENAAKFREVMAARRAEDAAYAAWLKATYPTGHPVKVYGVAALWAQFRASQVAEVAEVAEVEACPVLAEPGNMHFMTVHCVDCNGYRMAGMSLDTVERWYRSGHFSQTEYEAYVYAWSTGAYRYSVGRPTEEPSDPAVRKVVSSIRKHYAARTATAVG